MHKFCIALHFYYMSPTSYTVHRYNQCGINLLVLPYSSDDGMCSVLKAKWRGETTGRRSLSFVLRNKGFVLLSNSH